MNAPDFAEPVVGFRAWHVTGHDLVPWSAGAAGVWTPGVNVARCLLHPGRRGHHSPVADCSCGLYALADAYDPRLRHDEEAVGAVVGWGDVEVHRDGFRAQYAAVVALACPERCPPRHRERLRAAAAHHGVALVAVDDLADAARAYGRPIAFDTIPVPRRAPRRVSSGAPPLSEAGLEGVAVDEHLSVQITADGIALAPTPALARALAAAGEPGLPEPGAPVRRADVLVHAGGEHGLAIRTPVSGLLAAVDPGSRPWRIVIRPSEWEEEGAEIAWGRAGERLYAAHVAHGAERGDAFADLRTRWIHAHANIRSAADVLEALRAQRDRPRFQTELEVYEQVGERLRAALVDPAVARAVARLPTRMAWRLHHPESDLLLDGTGAVVCGTGPAEADLVLFASAEAADDYFSGSLDLAAALRSREVQSSAPPAALLTAASVLKPLHARYAAAARPA